MFTGRIFEYAIADYTIRSNRPGTLELRVHKDAQGVAQLVNDNFIEVYRGGLSPWSGIICHVERAFDQNGDPTNFKTIKAKSFEWLPYWRVVVPPAGEDYLVKDGPEESMVVDDAVKFFVRECMETGHADADRILSGFSVEIDDHEHADEKVLAARYEDNLGELLEKWAAAYNFDWWVDADIANMLFVLKTKVPRRGTDKSGTTIFTVNRHNLRELIYWQDDIDTTTLCYVGGPGEGATQVIREVYDGAEPTGWDRREIFIPAANAEYTDELDVVGNAWLSTFGSELQGVRFEINETDACQWPTHFDIGDLVTVYDSDWGVDKAAKIEEIHVRIAEDGIEYIELLVGEPKPSQWDLLQARLGVYSSFDDDSAPAAPADLSYDT